MGYSQVSSVAIILVNWNGYPFTSACLRSLKSVQYPNYSIILVDNASTDGSIERLKNEFISVIYIQNPINLGFTGGNNAGISYALEKGFDYVLLLNNDTEVKPDFLDQLIDFHKTHPKAGMVQPLILFNQARNIIWSAGGIFNSILATCHTSGSQKSLSTFPVQDRELDWATGCCVLIPKKAVETIGLLPAAYFAYFEDVDWSLRFKKEGFRIYLASQSIVFHEAGSASKKQFEEGMLSPTVFYLHARNQLFLIRRHLRPHAQFLAFPYHFIKYFGWITYFALRGRTKKLKAVVRGLRDGIILNPQLENPLCP